MRRLTIPIGMIGMIDDSRRLSVHMGDRAGPAQEGKDPACGSTGSLRVPSAAAKASTIVSPE